jgi:hypothetical protein
VRKLARMRTAAKCEVGAQVVCRVSPARMVLVKSGKEQTSGRVCLACEAWLRRNGFKTRVL